MKKLYETARDRKDARNIRLKQRREDSQEYSRFIALSNNHHRAIAKKYSSITKCECCGFERKYYYPEIHHIISKEKGGKNELNNVIALCQPCHVILHKQGKDYLKKEIGFDLDEYQKSIAGLETPKTYSNELLTLTYQGITKTILEWEKTTGIAYKTLISRRRAGWNIDEILSK